MNLKAIRARVGREGRKVAQAWGFPALGPIEVRDGKPQGAKTVDQKRVKEAPPSRPVLPKIHPLLATNPISYRETWVQRFKGFRAFGPTISMVDAGGELLADVSVEWGRRAEDNWTFRRLSLPKPQHVPGRTLVLASTGGGTYFHWMTDVLPRVALVRRAGYDPVSFDNVLVNGMKHPFQKETLRRLGIPANRCMSFPETEAAYEMQEAGLPSLPGVPGVVPPETVHFLREAFSPRKNSTGRKIFIGRAGARHRPLIHEEEILARLRKRGFESVQCGALSVQEQAEVFAAAEIVVAAHGAALTNLAFCRPGTRVVELFSPKYVNPCYRDLCVAAGLSHAAVIGNGEDWEIHLAHDRPSAPITASYGLVEKVLDESGC